VVHAGLVVDVAGDVAREEVVEVVVNGKVLKSLVRLFVTLHSSALQVNR